MFSSNRHHPKKCTTELQEHIPTIVNALYVQEKVCGDDGVAREQKKHEERERERAPTYDEIVNKIPRN